MDELKRAHAESPTSQVQFMEFTKANVKIQPTPFKSLKEEMAPMATSGSQLTFEKKLPKEEKSMSIEELMEKYMKEQENKAAMSFEGQHESSPSTFGVNIEEENLRYNEEITSRGNKELDKVLRVENEAETLKDFVAKEEKESTSPESYANVKDEVVKTMSKITLWGEMHKGLKNEKMTPTSEVDEYIQLNNEMKRTFVKKKIENIKKI